VTETGVQNAPKRECERRINESAELVVTDKLLGPVKGDCGCGCGIFGTVRKNGCVRGCGCAKCRGKRNRTKGLAKQRAARKALGVAPSHKFGDANEENWNDVLFQNEVKAGKQCGPAVTAWQRIELQAMSNQIAIGSRKKPVRAVLMPDGWGADGLVIVRLSTWQEIVRPALENTYDN
jgi:hypothetical protein